jgi:hypothetical protein
MAVAVPPRLGEPWLRRAMPSAVETDGQLYGCGEGCGVARVLGAVLLHRDRGGPRCSTRLQTCLLPAAFLADPSLASILRYDLLALAFLPLRATAMTARG